MFVVCAPAKEEEVRGQAPPAWVLRGSPSAWVSYTQQVLSEAPSDMTCVLISGHEDLATWETSDTRPILLMSVYKSGSVCATCQCFKLMENSSSVSPRYCIHSDTLTGFSASQYFKKYTLGMNTCNIPKWKRFLSIKAEKKREKV